MATVKLMRRNKLIFGYNKKSQASNYVLKRLYSEEASANDDKVQISFSNGKQMTISTGKYARMADGCTVVRLGDTSVMATTVSRTQTSGSSSFTPLIVDYKQKAAAAGRIPTNFLRRERGQNEHEVLTSRLIDRSLRPLFPDKYNYETQVICNTLAIDGINDPDILSINGASAALAVSDIPWNGPIGAVRVGCINNEVLINPTRHEIQESSLNLIVTATSHNLVVMLEGYANNILEQELRKALKVGVKECQYLVQGIQTLQKNFGKRKRIIESPVPLSKEILESIKSLSEMKLREIFSNIKYDKISRDNAITKLRDEVLTSIKSSYSDLDATKVLEAFLSFSKTIFRSLIFENNYRCDGRQLTELRNIMCRTDLFKPLHGSALFQRGQTQVLCTVTLDSPDSALKMDNVTMIASGIKEKNFFLHYEFPPYATNETGRTGATGRREIGHGALAEKGLRAVLPTDYPFTVRLTSEVLESNGSSSMASICGGSLALMDAGVPIQTPVAGVAMGLITKYEKNNPKNIEDYRILTDLLGIEDYLGDMDFKIAGSRKGFTALQADIKIPGLPLKIVMEALTRASEAKIQILGIMKKTIAQPRINKKDNMPVTEKINIPIHIKGKFMGIGGNNLKKIFVQTGVHINQEEDTKFILFAPNQSAMNEAKEMIDQFLVMNREPLLEFGGIYTAKIVEVKDIGLMVTIYPSMPPALLHNSQLDQRHINHPSALGFEVGQEIQVKYFGRDPATGTMRLSRKVLQVTNLKMKNFSDSS